MSRNLLIILLFLMWGRTFLMLCVQKTHPGIEIQAHSLYFRQDFLFISPLFLFAYVLVKNNTMQFLFPIKYLRSG